MKILVFYKNSAYAMHFLRDPQASMALLKGHRELKRFRVTHENHFQTLGLVENFLKRKTIAFHKASRGDSLDFNRYDCIITVGGDGTFLEAARHLEKQIILGINSDPAWSVGRFCHANPQNFEKILNNIFLGRAHPKKFHRLKLSFKNKPDAIHVLNDILICHENPAAMSRYYLKIGKIKEEQRSSGIWIASAAGSSGGIHSAGGKILSDEGKDYQYKSRELYKSREKHYVLKGGILECKQKITVTSLMREGVCFADGSHFCLPFGFGSQIIITHSPIPLNIITK